MGTTGLNEWPKVCRCRASYDQDAWETLPERGIVAYGTQYLELRDCACGSTLAIAKRRQRPAKTAST